MAAEKLLDICMVTTFYPPYHFGGDGVFVYRLVEELASRGHRLHVIFSVDAYRLKHPQEPEIAFKHHPNVTLYPLRSASPVLSALAAQQLGQPSLYSSRLKQFLGNQEFDVIHYHNVSLMGGPGVLGFGRAKVKLYTAHEYWLICPTHVLFTFNKEACNERRCLRCTLHSKRPPQLWRYTRLLNHCANKVDCFLMPSQFALERHHHDGFTAQMTHLPHFVPQPDLAVVQQPLQGERQFFLFVGRLEKLKGVQDLLVLFREYDQADLHICGSGGYENELKELGRGLPHVKFLGAVHPEKLKGMYQRALAVVVPSLCYETFGLTAAEALSHGTPAIVRNIGALPEIIEQSGAGFVFNTLDECKAQMERIRTDATLRVELGTLGCKSAARLWSAGVHIQRYLEMVAAIKHKKKSAANT